MVCERWQRPIASRCGFVPRSSPAAATSSFTFLRASKRSSPATGPAAAVILPARSITVSCSRPWRFPVSKSLKSCAGVTFTAPVPNFGSTRMASAMTGSSRPVSGWRTFLPTTPR